MLAIAVGVEWWPETATALQELQRELTQRALHELRWRPPAERALRIGAVFVATPRDPAASGAWAAAVVLEERRLVDSVVVSGHLDAPYTPGLLALREGRLLFDAVTRLQTQPDVLIVNASGRDHPRRAGLALHLGAACGLPTIGVTDRALVATGAEPPAERGARSPLLLDDEIVGYRVRTRADARAVVAHAAWRTDAETACELALRAGGNSRTPEPLRQSRQLARQARTDANPSP